MYNVHCYYYHYKSQYITLAALEPTLWHRPFHLPSYTAVLSAQKEVLAALILLKVLQKDKLTQSYICT
jgi:hypothetical protein